MSRPPRMTNPLRVLAVIVLAAGIGSVLAMIVSSSPSEHHASSDIGLDEEDLADFVEVAFVGDLGAVEGSESEDGLPETQYSATVEEQIAGPDLNDHATVNHIAGGGASDSGHSSNSHEGSQGLEEGQRYLFMGRIHPNGEWVTIVNRRGSIPINSPEQQERLVEKWEDLLND